jgi:hypothetical protein
VEILIPFLQFRGEFKKACVVLEVLSVFSMQKMMEKIEPARSMRAASAFTCRPSFCSACCTSTAQAVSGL